MIDWIRNKFLDAKLYIGGIYWKRKTTKLFAKMANSTPEEKVELLNEFEALGKDICDWVDKQGEWKRKN